MTENNICAISFNNYTVNEFSFKLNNEFVNAGEVSLSPTFERHILKTDEKNYTVSLSIKIKENNLPFEFYLKLSGIFTAVSSEFSEELIYQNAVAILFPYLRGMVSSLTSTANISPVILPVVNIVKMFEEESSQLND